MFTRDVMYVAEIYSDVFGAKCSFGRRLSLGTGFYRSY